MLGLNVSLNIEKTTYEMLERACTNTHSWKRSFTTNTVQGQLCLSVLKNLSTVPNNNKMYDIYNRYKSYKYWI